MHQKLVPGPFLMQEIACKKFFQKLDTLIEDYQKALKKLTLFFPLNLVLFNGPNYQKQKGPGTSDLSLSSLGYKFRKIPLLVMYYLTKFYDEI